MASREMIIYGKLYIVHKKKVRMSTAIAGELHRREFELCGLIPYHPYEER